MKKFKPNLVPNHKPDLGTLDLKNYIVSLKKDGVRLELKDGDTYGRSLKLCPSPEVRERFKALAERCQELGIILEGEFYMHGLKFTEINRFFKTANVGRKLDALKKDCFKFNLVGTKDTPKWETVVASEKSRLEAHGRVSKFNTDWPGRTPAFMSTLHEDLKMWPFDVFVIAAPTMVFEDRLNYIFDLFGPGGELHEFNHLVDMGDWAVLSEMSVDPEWLNNYYERALSSGWEGLILSHREGQYKFNRSTVKEATFFKMKEDRLEFDGIVIDVEEMTEVDPNAPKTVNELGRSVTSKLQEHRIPCGMAKGFTCEYNGFTFCVSLDGFSHEQRKELFENKEKYIGKHFVYRGMKSEKNVPRQAFFMYWRDEK